MSSGEYTPPAERPEVGQNDPQLYPDGPLLSEAYAQHRDAVERTVIRCGHSREEAEDVTQEAFIRVMLAGQMRPDSNEGAFIRRVAINRANDHYRRESHRSAPKTVDNFDNLTAVVPDPDPTPERAFEYSNFSPQVAHALRSLPEDFRKAVIMVDVEKFSYIECAAEMGVKRGTVASRVHRGRAQLKSLLTGKIEEYA